MNPRQPPIVFRKLRSAPASFVAAITLCLFLPLLPAPLPPAHDTFRFAILGDRTGETQPGVFELALKLAAASKPAFLLSVGDNIQGTRMETAQTEWKQLESILSPYRGLQIYLTPGNHDVWDGPSAELFRQFARRPLHYSFDSGPAHFVVLDNSRTEEFSPSEIQFLQQDLRANQARPLKFLVSHKPSWIFDVLLQNTKAPLHILLKKHQVRFVISGHIRQLLRKQFDGITYLSMPSAGGHLRGSNQYEDGWFHGYTVVEVEGTSVRFRVHELPKPHGLGRTQTLSE